MSWRYLDRVEGIAIDHESTLAHHQLMSLNKKENTLEYTIFYEPYKNHKKTGLTSKIQNTFIQEMNVKTPAAQSKIARMQECYLEFFDIVRPHGHSVGFQTKELAKALTLSIRFNQKFQMTGMLESPTLGYMTKKMTCREAEDQLDQNEDLYIMREIAYNTMPFSKRPEKEDFSFESVIQVIGDFAREQKLQMDFFRNADCIFRTDAIVKYSERDKKKISKMSIHEWADAHARYHVMNQYSSNSRNKTAPQKSVVPITESRTHIGFYNVMSETEKLVNGKSPFYSEIAPAIANYQKHAMAWKHFGFTS